MCKYFLVSLKRKKYTLHGWINPIDDITKINKLINIHAQAFLFLFFYFFFIEEIFDFLPNLRNLILDPCVVACLPITQSTELCMYIQHLLYLLYIQFHHIWILLACFFEMLNKLLLLLFSHLALSIYLIDFLLHWRLQGFMAIMEFSE